MAPSSPSPPLARGHRLGELRALGELASLPAAMPWLLAAARRGDRHPVLVLPGLGASDRSTEPLRRFLGALGYRPSPWQQGTNRGHEPELDRRLGALLDRLSDGGERRVSLVGWSLGGLHALRVARTRVRDVRQVITLGSPLGDELGQVSAPPFPLTSIYSRSDAIVPWRVSRVGAGARAENVEVEGSHLGLGVNPAVLLVIADRLAQPEDDWRPFERRGLPPFLYPDPERPER